jgi:hypothetical protein
VIGNGNRVAVVGKYTRSGKFGPELDATDDKGGKIEVLAAASDVKEKPAKDK